MKESSPEYLTTKEVAAYLRLNEKKVYALVADGKLPAARISGKWLFPRRLIDDWVKRNTVYPASGLMGALLDEMIIVQGSDDWLLQQALELFQTRTQVPTPSSRIGSLAGLKALNSGLSHVAGCHVDNTRVSEIITTAEGCYLLNLYKRQQGLLIDTRRHPGITTLKGALETGLFWADRQKQSGTYRLASKLFTQASTDPPKTRKGPFASHLEMAVAIRSGQADAGLGIQVAAQRLNLHFIPLQEELFKLAIPVAYASHPQMSRFLAFILDFFKATKPHERPGYNTNVLGHLEIIGAPKTPQRPERTAQQPDWAFLKSHQKIQKGKKDGATA
jgi:excisionase family DNA binding protein